MSRPFHAGLQEGAQADLLCSAIGNRWHLRPHNFSRETFLRRDVPKRLTVSHDSCLVLIRQRVVWHGEVVRLCDLHVTFSSYLRREFVEGRRGDCDDLGTVFKSPL